MSGENTELYHHDSFLRDQGGFSFHDDFSSIFDQRPGGGGGTQQDPSGLEPLSAPYMCFADYLHGPADYGSLARAFDLPDRGEWTATGELVFETGTGGGGDNTTASVGGGGSEFPVTPNSSISSSSTEAAVEEDSERWKKDQKREEEEKQQQLQQAKECEDGGDKSKKVSKPRKKGEKRQRVPRFAFMTKSEVDHLEDGYRWRKYGQKAVKNSPYPRSYYRCTTQKCSVKKRVERSFEDPTIVITTYEGQHTHQSPATIRGGSHIAAPPPTVPSSFRHDLLMHQLQTPVSSDGRQGVANPRMYLQSLPLPAPLQQFQLSEYGLLQDIVPSFVNSNQA